jgi:hypothetical protein
MSRSQSPQHRPSSDVKPAQHHRHHRHHQQPPPEATATSDSKDSLPRPQPLKARSNLDLEPNPFEQSFAPTGPPPSLRSSPIRRNSTVSVSPSRTAALPVVHPELPPLYQVILAMAALPHNPNRSYHRLNLSPLLPIGFSFVLLGKLFKGWAPISRHACRSTTAQRRRHSRV